jgi:hypothetical protein
VCISAWTASCDRGCRVGGNGGNGWKHATGSIHLDFMLTKDAQAIVGKNFVVAK